MVQFGTSGLRGLAVDLTDALVANYATVFVDRMPGDGTLLVGRDLRDSSSRIAAAVAAGAARAGYRAIDCGVLPTPALAMESAARGTAAIMVTGSHIPGDRNGLKFYDRGAEIAKSDEVWLNAGVAALPDTPPPSSEFSETADAAGRFLKRYSDFFASDALSGMRVGVFEHSSAARELMAPLLKNLGADVVSLGRSDSFVAVDTEAVSDDAREKLSGWALDHGLHAIISTDGDADRPMLADANGSIVPGDRLGPLTARLLAAKAIVTPVSSNTLVDLMADWHIVRTRIGSPYVIAEMEALTGQDVVGYEPNGGFLLGYDAQLAGRTLAPLMTRDFALPILAVLVEANARGLSVAALNADLPRRFTATDRLTNVPTEISKAIGAELIASNFDVLPEDARDVTDIDTTDGARMTLEDGRIVTVRPSGNAPELRCYAEADRLEAAERLMKETLSALRKAVDAAPT